MSDPTRPSELDPDRIELASVAARFLASRAAGEAVRAALEADEETLPPWWAELVDLGWLGLAVPTEHGGQGGTLADLAAVVEEWGRVVAPGPFPGSATVATVLGRHAPHLVAPVLAGEPAAVAAGVGTLVGEPAVGEQSGTGLAVSGTLRPIDGGGSASWFLVPVDVAGDPTRWCLLQREQLQVRVLRSADPTRRLAEVVVDGATVDADHVIDVEPWAVDELAAVVRAAECIGVASWCVRTAAHHAIDRVQFDRPIGQFQAVKHRCADALCRLEEARAATWDAAQLDPADEQFAVAVAAAGSLAPVAAFECAKDAVQVLGGIGYTWEHDVHLYLRRATVARHLDDPGRWRRRLVSLSRAGRRRTAGFELPAEAESSRQRVRAELAELQASDRAEWNTLLADGGWLCPHWPRPWGRDATGLEQLVIDEELRAAKIRRPHLQVAGWVLPTLIAHGTAAQQERFVGPSLRQEIRWCQLFSEPGAGSDLAALTTRAERVDGGWSLTGQKVWTTLAKEADYGLCLARTDPDAPKHDGISCFVVDMSTPGIDIRPLRELTGFALFNEVFLDEVFVPDEAVVGAVGDGWRCARTTLENERVSMASGSSFGPGVESVLELAERSGGLDDPVVVERVGRLLATAQGLAAMGTRTTLRAIAGAVPGPEASVRKLLGVEHEQRVQEEGMALLGAEAAVDEGPGATWFGGFLGNRALSIAGGTSEIQRNVIAERLLGLPRD